jgi:hypothetical protein
MDIHESPPASRLSVNVPLDEAELRVLPAPEKEALFSKIRDVIEFGVRLGAITELQARDGARIELRTTAPFDYSVESVTQLEKVLFDGIETRQIGLRQAEEIRTSENFASASKLAEKVNKARFVAACIELGQATGVLDVDSAKELQTSGNLNEVCTSAGQVVLYIVNLEIRSEEAIAEALKLGTIEADQADKFRRASAVLDKMQALSPVELRSFVVASITEVISTGLGYKMLTPETAAEIQAIPDLEQRDRAVDYLREWIAVAEEARRKSSQ